MCNGAPDVFLHLFMILSAEQLISDRQDGDATATGQPVGLGDPTIAASRRSTVTRGRASLQRA